MQLQEQFVYFFLFSHPPFGENWANGINKLLLGDRDYLYFC